ncbi:TPA: hypothetical protein N5O16_000189 [Enterobacter roggenkampii]|nr:hypothetical protein [Enterobacter roggenkampii]
MKKLEGYYLKSLSTVVKGLRENASKLEVQLFSTDAFIITVGDRVSRILRVDKAGEKLATTAFRLIFMIRAGIPSETVHTLVNEYLRDAPALRQAVLEGIRHSERFMANRNEVTANRQRMSSRLEEYFATEKGRGEYRLAGINSLLLVLNALDFIYLCGQVRDEKKPLASLLASGLAMVSQGTTVILPAIEKGLEAGKLTVSWVKGVGAAAGGAASMFSVFADGASTYEEWHNNRFVLFSLLIIKATVDVLVVTKSVGLLLEAISSVLEVKSKEKASKIIGLVGKYIADKLVNAIIIFICMFMFMLHDVLNYRGISDYWEVYQYSLCVLFAISLVLSGLIAYFAYKAHANNCCKLAEEIFQLLGVKNVAVVNLNKITKKREQHLKNKGELSSDDVSKIACPSSKFIYSGEWWFYY